MIPSFFENTSRSLTKKVSDIDDVLLKGTYIQDRNFDQIDVGTGFYVSFDDGEKERFVLTEKGITTSSSYKMISLDSELGKAVLNKKVGDPISYYVSASHCTITGSIAEIDRIKSHYVRFIREEQQANRICESVRDEYRLLKKNDMEEYMRRHSISYSQLELALEERRKLGRAKDKSAIRRAAYLDKIIDLPIAEIPKDGTIGVGSHVQLRMSDKKGNESVREFEFINQAVSTELNCHYVERISALGNAIYGLGENDTFFYCKNRKIYLGLIETVDNYAISNTERVR